MAIRQITVNGTQLTEYECRIFRDLRGTDGSSAGVLVRWLPFVPVAGMHLLGFYTKNEDEGDPVDMVIWDLDDKIFYLHVGTDTDSTSIERMKEMYNYDWDWKDRLV